MKHFKYLILLAAIILFASCSNLGNPEKLPHFSDFKLEDVNIKSKTNYILKVSATVQNPVNKKFSSSDLSSLVYKNGKPFAEVEIGEPILIPRLFLGRQTFVLKVNLLDVKQLISLGLTFRDLNPDDFVAEYSGKCKSGIFPVRIKGTVTGKQVESYLNK